jgi:diadenosine hexaphosphate hydrolase (ATP-forming)
MAGTMRTGGPSTPGTATEGAGGVVFDPGGRVLLIRQRSGPWVFPKGHLDPGEEHLATALREVAEEAGIQAACPRPDRRWSTSYVNDRGEPRHITWFRLEAPAGAVPEMREPQFPEGAFLTPDEALARLTFEEDRALLRRVLDGVADTERGAGEQAGGDTKASGDPEHGA